MQFSFYYAIFYIVLCINIRSFKETVIRRANIYEGPKG